MQLFRLFYHKAEYLSNAAAKAFENSKVMLYSIGKDLWRFGVHIDKKTRKTRQGKTEMPDEQNHLGDQTKEVKAFDQA